jgi:hypothetical protein
LASPGNRKTPTLSASTRVLFVLLGIMVACTTDPEPSATPQSPPESQSQTPETGVPASCVTSAHFVQPEDALQEALTAAGPGATLCFKPGVYRLRQDLHPLLGQTLIFRPGAVLNGSEVVKNWTHVGSYWISSGHQQNLSEASWMTETSVACPVVPTACIYEDVFFDGRPLRHVLTLSALDEPNEVFFDRPADTIYLATDPTDRLVEATVAKFAITSPAGDVTTDDVTIRGATIEKFAYAGIYTEADHWTIEDSELRYNHGQAIGIYGGSGEVIKNTRIHHNGVIGMITARVDDFTVQNSEFDHNNYLHAGPEVGGYGEGAVKILLSHGVVFRDNWSHDNVGDGLWFDTDNYDILIENNVLEDNSRNGLHYEASFDATVRYNTIRNNGTDWYSHPAGILNATSKNVEYYGNRIEGNRIRSIMILWSDRGQSATLGERQSANLYFHDNVIVLDDNPQSWVGVFWDQDPRVFTSNNRFQGNTYYARSDGQREGERYWRWDGIDLTWTGWRSYGFDTTGSYIRT